MTHLPKDGPLKYHKIQQIREYTLNDVLHISKNSRHGGNMDSQVPSDISEDELVRRLDCEEAMEIAFARLLSDAVVAGWREMEVAVILADIADDNVLRLARRSKVRKFN